jgi:uncharacterized membrane protein
MLTYTSEMKEQDKLWESENESLIVMKRLQKEIIAEAVSKGFKGIVDTYTLANEVITEVFDSLEDLEKERETGNGYQIATCGYCKSLIEILEEQIRRKK